MKTEYTKLKEQMQFATQLLEGKDDDMTHRAFTDVALLSIAEELSIIADILIHQGYDPREDK